MHTKFCNIILKVPTCAEPHRNHRLYISLVLGGSQSHFIAANIRVSVLESRPVTVIDVRIRLIVDIHLQTFRVTRIKIKYIVMFLSLD